MRKMGPLAADHPLVYGELKCSACTLDFEPGNYVTLVLLGPGDSAEARLRAREGRPYNAVALPIHWPCATGEED